MSYYTVDKKYTHKELEEDDEEILLISLLATTFLATANEYVDFYSTLGLDYTHSKEYKFRARTNNLRLNVPHFVELSSYSNFRFKTFGYKNLSFTPEANVSLKYAPYTNGIAKNKDDVELKLASKNLVNFDLNYGGNVEYNTDKVKVGMKGVFYHNVLSQKVNDRRINNVYHGYKFGTTLDVNVYNNVSVRANISYSNHFKAEKFGYLKGSLAVDYKW